MKLTNTTHQDCKRTPRALGVAAALALSLGLAGSAQALPELLFDAVEFGRVEVTSGTVTLDQQATVSFNGGPTQVLDNVLGAQLFDLVAGNSMTVVTTSTGTASEGGVIATALLQADANLVMVADAVQAFEIVVSYDWSTIASASVTDPLDFAGASASVLGFTDPGPLDPVIDGFSIVDTDVDGSPALDSQSGSGLLTFLLLPGTGLTDILQFNQIDNFSFADTAGALSGATFQAISSLTLTIDAINVVEVVPVPATLALMALGLAGLGASRRGQRLAA